MISSLTIICNKVISGIRLISNKICYLYEIRGLNAVKKISKDCKEYKMLLYYYPKGQIRSSLFQFFSHSLFWQSNMQGSAVNEPRKIKK